MGMVQTLLAIQNVSLIRVAKAMLNIASSTSARGVQGRALGTRA